MSPSSPGYNASNGARTEQVGLDQQAAFDMFLGQDRLAGSDSADRWNAQAAVVVAVTPCTTATAIANIGEAQVATLARLAQHRTHS